MLLFGAFVFCGSVLFGCGSEQADEDGEPEGVDIFEDLVGIYFYEVRRTFDTGVSYDSMGFVQLPEWHMRWGKKDSMLVYSPWEDRMVGYKIYHDHADYFHFARDSWRMITLSRDSVILQRLSLNGLRVDKARSRKSGGSGLGLAIVRLIVERNRGEISVDSEIGQGTTFSVSFPVFDMEEES